MEKQTKKETPTHPFAYQKVSENGKGFIISVKEGATEEQVTWWLDHQFGSSTKRYWKGKEWRWRIFGNIGEKGACVGVVQCF